MMANDADRWKYPALAKPDSDGAFCYHVQRRISVRISVWLARYIGPNVVTGIDLCFGVAAAVLVMQKYWVWGVVLLQLFGVFSCVDGEVARISGRSSKFGDFLDTLTDRVTEMLLLGAIAFSLRDRVAPLSAISASFASFGGVFMLTTSSEKFRSVWQMGYPKRRLERLFCLFCAGSDSRLLVLSIGIIVSEFTDNGSFLLCTLWALAAVACVNFLVRISLVYYHFSNGESTKS